MANKCKVCGKNCEKEYCMQHKPRKPIPKISSKKKERIQIEGKKDTSVRDSFFLSIWNKRPHRSEISGQWLIGISSSYFHHILEKEKYPEAEFWEDNIILVTLDEHTNIHSDMYKYEEVNKRRIKLLEKWEKQQKTGIESSLES